MDTKVNPIILTVFAFSDIILYGLEIPILQYPIAILSYLFIILIFIKNQKLGILYFISFNLLSIGIGNYWGTIDVVSYWGLRVGVFSFNILFSIFLTFIICTKKRWKNLFPNDPFTKFFIIFFIWGLIVGLILTLLGKNYIDNFRTDFMIFFPIILYIILCRDIKSKEYDNLFKYLIPITIYSLLLAFIINRRASYSQESFLIANAIAALTPFGVLILRKYFNKYQQIVYIFIYIILFGTMAILLAGKLIIGYILLGLWWISLDKKWRYINWTFLIIGIPLVVYILEYLVEITASNSGITAFKISQVLSLLNNPEFLSLAGEYSSVGNIIAEGYTLFHYLIIHPIYLIFGKGFGGGIQDLYGFLSPFAGAAGYAEIDAIRNDFFNLHIAPYKILVDGGIIIFIYYIKILYKVLHTKSAIGFLAFIMLLFFFYVSKELMLLTYILLRMTWLNNIDFFLYSNQDILCQKRFQNSEFI